MLSAVIFDLDGTLTRTPNPWQHIHECVGVWADQAAGHFGEWLSGKICYDEFCRKDAGLWRGRPLAEIQRYLDMIEVNRHVPEVVGALVQRRIPSIIISSGFTYVARKIQVSCNWEPLLVYANELIEGRGDCASYARRRSGGNSCGIRCHEGPRTIEGMRISSACS
jgi:phosphoserine phosphatase